MNGRTDINTLPDPTRTVRRRLLLVVLVIASVLLWMWAGPKVVRTHFVAEVSHAQGTSAWEMNWTERATQEKHGQYVELRGKHDGLLRINVSGSSSAPDKPPFEFWLYSVKSDIGEQPDLVGLLDRSEAPGSRDWIAFEQGPGVIYVGQAAGELTVPLESERVQLAIAKTPRGGPVTFGFGGEEVTIDTYASPASSELVLLPSHKDLDQGQLSVRLPSYDLTNVELRWKSQSGVKLALSKPRFHFKLGERTLFQRAAVLEEGAGVTQAGPEAWANESDSPTLRVQGPFSAGAGVFVAGVLITFGVLCGLIAFARACVVAGPWLLRWRATPVLVVAGVVLLTHVIVAVYSPTVVTADGMDYLDAADALATGHGFQRFPIYKAPGLSVVIAAAMKVSDHFLDAYAWLSAGLSVLMSLMVYWVVRSRAPHGWALATALIVGVHPTLIVYESHLLRELPSAFILTAVALCLIRIRDGLAAGRDAWGWTGALVLLCAAGAYMRENLQLLAPLVPVLLLVPGAGAWKKRALRAGTVLVIAPVLLWPRVAPIYEKFGMFSVVSPKIQGNRLLSSWVNEIADMNDTTLFTREQWQDHSRTALERAVTDYEFTSWVQRTSKRAMEMGVGPQGPLVEQAEGLGRSVLDESVARDPLKHYGAAARAFVSQLGLWNVQTGRMREYAAANEFYSRALRGEAVPFATNFAPDTLAALGSSRLRPNVLRLQELMLTSRRSIKHLQDAPLARLFNEWFYAFRAVRPLVGVLFLAGVAIAVRRRDYTLAGIGAIVLLSTFGAAYVVGTPTDRFGVPFIPLMVCLAMYAGSHLAAHRAACRRAKVV